MRWRLCSPRVRASLPSPPTKVCQALIFRHRTKRKLCVPTRKR
jgi:hypothetical protein